jgi:hypothetical protein
MGDHVCPLDLYYTVLTSSFTAASQRPSFISIQSKLVMPHYDDKGDTFASTSHFLSPSNTPPRKSPSRQSINNRRSTSSLRGSPTLARVIDDEPENSANGLHSLAHKLAVALLPEPSTSSQLLAEEFGIEYDDGAETIDEDIHNEGGLQIVVDDAPSFTDEMGPEAPFHNSTSQTEVLPQDFDLVFEPPTNARQKKTGSS